MTSPSDGPSTDCELARIARWPPPKVPPSSLAMNGGGWVGVTRTRGVPGSGDANVGNAEGEGAAGTRDALDPETPAVQLDQALRQRQPEAGAGFLAAPRFRLHELLEDPCLISERDPNSCVFDRHLDLAVHPDGADVDVTAVRRELHRVGQEVVQDLAELALVSLDLADIGVDRHRDSDRVLRRALADHRDAAVDERLDGDRTRLELHLPCLDLRKIKDIVDEPQQVLAGREDIARVLHLLLVQRSEHLLEQDLGEADDRVQRRTQLVAHVREEDRLVAVRRVKLRVQLPELVIHRIEVRSKAAQLVPVRDVDMSTEV